MSDFLNIKTGDEGLAIMVDEIVYWESNTESSVLVHLSTDDEIEVNLSFDAFSAAVASALKYPIPAAIAGTPEEKTYIEE